MNEKTKLINPTTAYFHGDFAKQPQEAPGLQNLMEPRPDCGEKSYIGHGRLAGRKRLRPGIWTQTGGGYGEVGCRS